MSTSETESNEVISIMLTNIHNECSLKKIFEECIFLKIGDIVQIVLSCYYPKEGETGGPRTSKAYIYFKPLNKDFITVINNTKKPFEIVFFENDEPWFAQKNPVTNHFRLDHYEQKRILIQSINSNRNSTDIHYLFREHGDMEQSDFVWIQTNDLPLPTRAQVYLYFREWGEEIFTYKLLEELNDVGVFTIKYDYNGYKDLLWVYEICTKDETSTEFSFEFGKYRKWIPEDDPKYGTRNSKNNKLNWFFTKEGKFAYANKIVEDELIKHNGLFIGPDKIFYKIEVTRSPSEYAWKASDDPGEEDLDENEIDLREVQQMVLGVIQRCMKTSSALFNDEEGESEEKTEDTS